LGVGLSLVKGLVELHHGRIHAFSEGLGRGSEFTVGLPLLPEPEKSGEIGALPDPAISAAPLRVLVVEDNVEAAEMLGQLVELWGHEVRTVHDGVSAISVVSSFRPHIVLLDIGLPGASGYEVARQIRQQEDLQGILLLAMTGYGQEEDQVKAMDAGFDEHLVKPVEPEKLYQWLVSAGSRIAGG
jgi:CheY-like chemotaxis protein